MHDHREGRASIRRALARSILITTCVALLISAVASVALEIWRFRTSTEASIESLAGVLAIYAQPALEFDDRTAGDEVLAALHREPSVLAATIFDASGAVFARYVRGGAAIEAPSVVGPDGLRDVDGALHFVAPVGDGAVAAGHVTLVKSLAGRGAVLRQSAWTITGAMVLALALASLAASRLRAQIAAPLEEIGRSAEAMANGDLTLAPDVRRSDELGVLARSFDRTRASLGLLVATVREHALAITGDANSLAEESEGLSEQAALQQAAVSDTREAIDRVGASARAVRDNVDSIASTATETSSSVTELDATARRIDEHMDTLLETVDASASSISQLSAAVRQIAGNADALGGTARSATSSVEVLRESVRGVETNAQTCEQLAAKTSESAEHGSSVVGEVVRGMEQIDARFQGLEKIVNDLSERSDMIDEVVQVIQAVVAETNLLALNASIISSQAGEHGRAFAVVAQQIKSLADRTAGSTREIAGAMEAVRSGIEDAVRAVGDGAQDVRRGVGLSEVAGGALDQIRRNAEQSGEMVGEIVRSAEVQAADIAKVEQAMRALAGGVEQIVVGTHEQDKVATEMLGGVEQMRQLAREVKNATSEQSRQSGHMAQAVEEVAHGVHGILDAAENQHREIEKIAEALAVFRDNTAESRRRADALRRCVESLLARARQLGEGVGRFSV
ncbi:MAG: methyl-accepting chemotaxis protein [Myxococcota bacterium]